MLAFLPGLLVAQKPTLILADSVELVGYQVKVYSLALGESEVGLVDLFRHAPVMSIVGFVVVQDHGPASGENPSQVTQQGASDIRKDDKICPGKILKKFGMRHLHETHGVLDSPPFETF